MEMEPMATSNEKELELAKYAKQLIKLNDSIEFKTYKNLLNAQKIARVEKMQEPIFSEEAKANHNFLAGEVSGLSTAINFCEFAEKQFNIKNEVDELMEKHNTKEGN